jgi:hypothetical protein
MASAPPGNTVASFTKKLFDVSALTSFADTVMFAAVVLANDKPINVWVVPELTVAVTVDGLPDVPMFAVTFDLNAILSLYVLPSLTSMYCGDFSLRDTK